MERILTVAEMRNSDAMTIAGGVSARELVGRAAEALFHSANWTDPIAVVCGSGNNGADGYALAALLADDGHRVSIFRLSERTSPEGDYYLELLKTKPSVSVRDFGEDFSLEGFAMIVDCIFGTGFHGAPEGREREVILEINRCHGLGAFVLSVDINSGLNGKNGLGETVVYSDLTVSLGCYQPGHFLGRAMDVMKNKVNRPIGIEPVGDECFLPKMADYAKAFPSRVHDANKGKYGYVALIGGSVRYSGAAKLANLSAEGIMEQSCTEELSQSDEPLVANDRKQSVNVPILEATGRAGAGVVKLAVPASVGFAVMPYLLESTLFPLSEDENHSFVFCEEEIRELTANTKTVAVGMGFGGGPEVEKLLRFLLSKLPENQTLIIDADGLNTLSKLSDLKEVLSKASCRVVLTPHLMEFARLTGLDREEIKEDSLKWVRQYSALWNCTVLLKGPATLVSDGKETYVVDAGAPGMATAGSGDVLSGVLAAVFASGDLSEHSVAFRTAAGAYLAGKAGELAQEKYTDIGMMAGDTAKELPNAIRLIRSSIC